jgi:hypothetical protein
MVRRIMNVTQKIDFENPVFSSSTNAAFHQSRASDLV